MKLLLYPKGLLEAAWRKDKKLYADGDAGRSAQMSAVWRPVGSASDGKRP